MKTVTQITKQRRSKTLDRTRDFRKKRRDLGFTELSHAFAYEDDVEYIDTLLETLNFLRTEEQESEGDDEILFRIDNISSEKSIKPDNLYMIIDRQRIKVPVKAIQPGTSFILRRHQAEELAIQHGFGEFEI